MSPIRSERVRVDGGVALPCTFCGRSHFEGSRRQKACEREVAQRRATPSQAAVTPQLSASNQGGPFVDLGELSRLGEGVRAARPVTPHSVFTRQILPSDIAAPEQGPADLLSTASAFSRARVATLRAAARASVRAWRQRGVEPTYALMTDMDVHEHEADGLKRLILQATAAQVEALYRRNLTVTSNPVREAEVTRRAIEAVRTVKGLCLSPSVALEVLKMAAPNLSLAADDFESFAIGLRAIGEKVPAVHDALNIDAADVSREALRPVVAVIHNLAAYNHGYLIDGEEGPLPPLDRDDVCSVSLSNFEEVRTALASIVKDARAVNPAAKRLSITDDCARLLALPRPVARDLLAHDLSFDQWRSFGWERAIKAGDNFTRVLFDPYLVKMREQGVPESLVEAAAPWNERDIIADPYFPQRFLAGDSRWAVVGASVTASERGDVARRMKECVDSLLEEVRVRERMLSD